MALMTMGVNAQTLLTFENETVGERELTLGEEGGFQAYVNTDKTNNSGVATDGGKRFGGTNRNAVVIKQQWKPAQQVDGEKAVIRLTVPSTGIVRVFARTSSGNVADTEIQAYQNNEKIYDETKETKTNNNTSKDGNASCYNLFEITGVKAGTLEIRTVSGMNANFYGFEFEEVLVPETVGTLWTFDDAEDTYTELTNYDNLYIHANAGGHAVNKVAGAATKAMTSGSVVVVSNYLEVPGNSATTIPNALSKRRDAANTASLGEYLAFDVDKAGTAYVLIRTKEDNADRLMRMNFQLASDNSFTQAETTATAELTEMTLKATGAGTFFIYGTMAVRVFAVNFVPEDGPTTAVNTVKAGNADGKWYNLQGQEVAVPTKGLFIKDGKKYVIK